MYYYGEKWHSGTEAEKYVAISTIAPNKLFATNGKANMNYCSELCDDIPKIKYSAMLYSAQQTHRKFM